MEATIPAPNTKLHIGLITSASIANDVGRKLPLCKRKVNVGATGEAVVIGDQGIQRQVFNGQRASSAGVVWRHDDRMRSSGSTATPAQVVAQRFCGDADIYLATTKKHIRPATWGALVQVQLLIGECAPKVLHGGRQRARATNGWLRWTTSRSLCHELLACLF
jgi:hypothetical protein